jgi:hypothetical protein
METYISAMPLWAIAVFIPAFIYSITFIANPAKQAALNAGMPPAEARSIQIGVFGFYILYLAYVSIFSLKGVFAINTLPPRIFVWATLPLAIILFVIVGNTGLFKKLLRSVKLESLIRLHTFRILGVFFIILYFYHLLPAGMAFADGLGDIITALLAVPVANMVAKKKPGSITAVYAWNILGMLDIVNVMVIAVRNAMKSLNNAGPGEFEMTIFPFVWFPAFAPATILFLHIAVFRKLQLLKPSRQ